MIAFERKEINQAFTKSGCHWIIYEVGKGRETCDLEGNQDLKHKCEALLCPKSPLSRGMLPLNMNFNIIHLSFSSLFFKIEQPLEYKDDVLDTLKIYTDTLCSGVLKRLCLHCLLKSHGEFTAFIFEKAKQN